MNWLLKMWNLVTAIQQRVWAFKVIFSEAQCFVCTSRITWTSLVGFQMGKGSLMTHRTYTGIHSFNKSLFFFPQVSFWVLTLWLPFGNANGCLSSVKLMQVGGGRGQGKGFYSLGKNQQTWIMIQSPVMNMKCSYTLGVEKGLSTRSSVTDYPAFRSWFCY